MVEKDRKHVDYNLAMFIWRNYLTVLFWSILSRREVLLKFNPGFLHGELGTSCFPDSRVSDFENRSVAPKRRGKNGVARLSPSRETFARADVKC